MGQADAVVKLAAFQKGAVWQQSQVIEKGGGDCPGKQHPECGRGISLRLTARDNQQLACSTDAHLRYKQSDMGHSGLRVTEVTDGREDIQIEVGRIER